MNEFIELLRTSNGYCEKNVRFNTIVLDNSIHSIIDNGIICNQLNWKSPIYDKEKRDYVEWDYKYDVISSVFHTEEPKNLIWLKFTQKGHVGVVAKSFDINFDSKNDDGKPISSDVLVKEVGESWDKSFVMIFPMTSDILGNRSVGDLELGIGERGGCGQKPGLPRASKGAESLYILKTKSILHYRFITNVVL